jgi:DNA-binding transcriptional ArsR family regulator
MIQSLPSNVIVKRSVAELVPLVGLEPSHLSQQLGVLRRAGVGEDRLQMKIDEGATHSEGDWGRRFPEALKFLFEVKRNQAM